MDFDFTPAQQAFRNEIREYLASIMPPNSANTGRGEHSGPDERRVMRQLGSDGWLGIGFPKEYGGQGRGPVDQFIFLDEALRAGAPLSYITLMTVGPALVRFGSDEQRRRFLPGIISGETVFSIGYSEPAAGTDLAGLSTVAHRVGEEYVVTGNKYFTSGADTADYIWLAARTDGSAQRHRGLSVLIVPTSAAGFSAHAVPTLSSHVTSATFFDGVRVAAANLVGEENDGWKVITGQLNLERLMMVMPGPLELLYQDTVAWTRAAPAGSGRVIDQTWVRLNLARVRAKLDALTLMTWRVITEAERGPVGPGDASIAKIFGSEFFVDACRVLLDTVGQAGYVQRGSPGAVLHGRLEEAYRVATVKTFGGGVNEVQREIVARTGLGLPVVSRRIEPPKG